MGAADRALATLLLAAATIAVSTQFDWIVFDALFGHADLSLVNRVFWIGAVPLSLVLCRGPVSLSAVRWSLDFVALVGVFSASVLWSVSPATTISRASLLLIVALVCIAVVRRLEAVYVVRTVSITLTAVVVAGVGISWFECGTYGVCNGHVVGFSHRNAAGLTIAGLIVAAVAGQRLMRSPALIGCCLAAAGYLVVLLIDTRTALVASVIGLGVAFALRGVVALARTGALRLTAVAGVAIVIVGIVGVLLFPTLVDVLDRGLHMTGRVSAWVAAIDMLENPYLGQGYNAFWSSPEGERLAERLGYSYKSFHNMYIESLVDTGIVGLCAFLGWVACSGYRGCALMARGDPMGILTVSVVVFFMVACLAESLAQRPNQVWMFLMILTTVVSASEAFSPCERQTKG